MKYRGLKTRPLIPDSNPFGFDGSFTRKGRLGFCFLGPKDGDVVCIKIVAGVGVDFSCGIAALMGCGVIKAVFFCKDAANFNRGCLLCVRERYIETLVPVCLKPLNAPLIPVEDHAGVAILGILSIVDLDESAGISQLDTNRNRIRRLAVIRRCARTRMPRFNIEREELCCLAFDY